MEQRLIDANKLTREEILHLWYHLPNGDMACPKIDIDNAPTVLTIPENPTNGDMIKAMFPNIEINGEYIKSDHLINVYFGTGTASQFFEIDWWNSPYKRGETE